MLKIIFPEASYASGAYKTSYGLVIILLFLIITAGAAMVISWFFNRIQAQFLLAEAPAAILGWALFILLVIRPLVGFGVYFLLRAKAAKAQ